MRPIRTVIVSLLTVSLITSAAVMADFDRGWIALQRGEYATAYRELLSAAEQGDSGAKYLIGVMYDRGEGVAKNLPEAARWYRRAAELEHVMAQYNLAVMYHDGDGVGRNYEEAAHWYRRAAEQGEMVSQFNLGTLYIRGEGVPRDYSEAARWYQRAAEQGYASAQVNLGILNAQGAGVPASQVQAYLWWNLAAAQGSESGRANRDEIGGRMTAVQIAEAQRLSAEFQPRSELAANVVRSTQSANATDTPLVPNELTREVQQYLADLGFDPGPADGLYGPRTASAIEAFQRENNIEPDGVVSTTLAALLGAMLEFRQESFPTPIAPAPEIISTGTGFFVTSAGHFVTNQHVIDGCQIVRVVLPLGAVDARVMAMTENDDLAVLKVPDASVSSVATFRAHRREELGEDVMVAGYPLRGLLASDLGVASGAISALGGLGDDRRFLQITAPVQPGNSGGPILDSSGKVIGVVVSKLDAMSIAELTGDIPQNVNFAIKGSIVRAFLDIHQLDYMTGNDKEVALTRSEIALRAREFTFPVECWN